MEDSFRNLIIGSILGLLFVFSLFTFVFSTSSDYGKDTTSITEDYYDISGINESLTNVQGDAETFRDIASQGGNDGTFSLVEGFFDGVGAFFGLAFNMFDFVVNLFEFILVGTLNLIFANPLITGVAIAVVIIFALFGLFRFLKQGS